MNTATTAAPKPSRHRYTVRIQEERGRRRTWTARVLAESASAARQRGLETKFGARAFVQTDGFGVSSIYRTDTREERGSGATWSATLAVGYVCVDVERGWL